MAFIAPIAGSGVFANLALAALGIGIQLAAAYFFPQKVKGPRAESTKAQTAKYGDPLARVHGHGRTAGACIWLKGDQVDEHRQTERQGGKGLGPQVTTFTYTCDVAIAFAWNGPAVGIPRIWADDKLILDNSADSLEELLEGSSEGGIGVAGGASIRIYRGTQDQTPDPDIEADRGVGNVPAWPGIVYVVIRNFPLDEFGIRVPNFEAEVVMQGPEVWLETAPSAFAPGFNSMDSYGRTMVVAHELPATIGIVSLPNFIQVSEHVVQPGITLLGAGPYVTRRGDVVVTQFNVSPAQMQVYDSGGGGLLQTILFASTGAFGSFCDIVVNGVNYLFLHQGKIVVFSNSGDGWSLVADAIGSGVSILGGSFTASPEFLYFISGEFGTLNSWDWSDGVGMTPSGSLSPAGLSGEPFLIYYDEEVDAVFIVTETGIYAYEANRLLDNLLYSNTGLWVMPALEPTTSTRLDGPAGTGTIVVGNISSTNNGDVWLFNKSDLSVNRHIDFDETDWTVPNQGGFVTSNSEFSFLIWRSSFTDTVKFLPRIGTERIPLATVVAAECGFVDLPNDVSLLIGDVEGYVVREGTPPRGVLEDLMRVKFFDFTQANGTTKFFMRTNVSSRALTIPEDLGFAEGSNPDPKFVSEEYVDFREVPYRVVLDYQSAEADYRIGSQSVSAPEGQNEGTVPLQFQTSLILTDDEAAQTADIFLNETLDASNIYHSTTGPKFLELHPGDVVDLDLDEDRQAINAVVTRMQGDLLLTMDFLLRTTIYESDAVGVPTPNNPQSLLGLSRIAPVFIDGHLLRAADDGNQFYVGVYLAEGGRFNSGTIYKSNDLGASYNPWLGFTTASLRGIAQVVLPDRPHPEAWDYASTLVFHIASKKGVPNLPASVTEEQLLADDELNGFAVRSGNDWEYIQAAEITSNTDGTWTLAKLLRGRKGTDFAMAGHAIGDAVVYLDPNALDRPPDGEKDLVRKYAAIATSTVFTDQFAVTFTNTSRGWRPWSPWGVTGIRDGSGNLTINWFRRDRLGQHWPESGPEDPPMSETTEAYKVFIYSLSAGVLRTIDTVISEASYSAALQTTDFGAPVPVDELMIGVVQVSSTYGNGVERLALI